MILLAIDGGYAALGWALLEVRARTRVVRFTGSVKTKPEDGTETERMDQVTRELGRRARLNDATAIAVEDHVYQGPRSESGPQFSRGVRMAGRFEGIAAGLDVPWVTLSRGEVLRHFRLGGKTPKSRVRALIEQLTGYRPANEHEVDAVALGLVAATRLEARRF